MKNLITSCLTIALATTLTQAAPADDVAAAARKLGEAPNFSWTVVTEFANSQFPATPVEGATERGGYTVSKVTFNDTTFTTVRKGEQSVSRGGDGTWLTAEERRAQFSGTGSRGAGGQGGGGTGRGGRGGMGFFGGGTAQMDFPKDVANLAAKIKDAKLVDGAIVGTLTADDAASLLTFGRGGRGSEDQTRPAPKNASGSVKFWLKAGALVKYAVNVKGTVTTPNGDERDVDLTTTTEIKDVGTTKVVVPEEAKKKLGA